MADNITPVYDKITKERVNPSTIARAVIMDDGSNLEEYLSKLNNNLDTKINSVSDLKSTSLSFIDYYKYIPSKIYNKDLSEFDFNENVKPGAINNGWTSVSLPKSQEGTYRWKRRVLCKTVRGVFQYDKDRENWKGTPEFDDVITTSFNINGAFWCSLYKLTNESDLYKIEAPAVNTVLDTFPLYYNNTDQWHQCNLDNYLTTPGMYLYRCGIKTIFNDKQQLIIDPNSKPTVVYLGDFYSRSLEVTIYWERSYTNLAQTLLEQKDWLERRISLGLSTIDNLKEENQGDIKTTPFTAKSKGRAVFSCTLTINTSNVIQLIGDVIVYNEFTPTQVTYTNLNNYPKIWGVSTFTGEKVGKDIIISKKQFNDPFNANPDNSSALKFSELFENFYKYDSGETITYWFTDNSTAKTYLGQIAREIGTQFSTLWSSTLTVFGNYISTCTEPVYITNVLRADGASLTAHNQLTLYTDCEFAEILDDELFWNKPVNTDEENQWWNANHKLYPRISELNSDALKNEEFITLNTSQGSNYKTATYTRGDKINQPRKWTQIRPKASSDYPNVYQIDIKYETENNIYTGDFTVSPGSIFISTPRCISNYSDVGSRGVLGQACRIRLLTAIKQVIDDPTYDDSEKNIWVFSPSDQRNFKDSELFKDEKPSDGDVIIPQGNSGNEAYALYYDIVANNLNYDENGKKQIVYHILKKGNNSHKFKILGSNSDEDYDVREEDGIWKFNPEKWTTSEAQDFVHIQTALIEELIANRVTAEQVIIKGADNNSYTAGMFNGTNASSILDGYTGIDDIEKDHDEISGEPESSIRIFAGDLKIGSSTLAEMPFRVYENGLVVATKLITTEGSIILGTDGKRNTFSNYLADRIGQSKEEQEAKWEIYKNEIIENLDVGQQRKAAIKFAAVDTVDIKEIRKRDYDGYWFDKDAYEEGSNRIHWETEVKAAQNSLSKEKPYLIQRDAYLKYKKTPDGKFVQIQKIGNLALNSGHRAQYYADVTKPDVIAWLNSNGLLRETADSSCDYEYDAEYKSLATYSSSIKNVNVKYTASTNNNLQPSAFADANLKDTAEEFFAKNYVENNYYLYSGTIIEFDDGTKNCVDIQNLGDLSNLGQVIEQYIITNSNQQNGYIKPGGLAADTSIVYNKTDSNVRKIELGWSNGDYSYTEGYLWVRNKIVYKGDESIKYTTPLCKGYLQGKSKSIKKQTRLYLITETNRTPSKSEFINANSTSSPQVNETHPYLWKFTSTEYNTTEYDSYGNPINNEDYDEIIELIGVRGEDGTDADTVDYIYCLTENSEPPTKEFPEAPCSNVYSGFYPESNVWYDDKLPLSYQQPYLWQARASKNGNVWGAYDSISRVDTYNPPSEFHYNLLENQEKNAERTDILTETYPQKENLFKEIFNKDICVSFEAKKTKNWKDNEGHQVYLDIKDLKDPYTRIARDEVWIADRIKNSAPDEWTSQYFTLKIQDGKELILNGRPIDYNQTRINGDPVWKLGTNLIDVINNNSYITLQQWSGQDGLKPHVVFRNIKIEYGTSPSVWSTAEGEQNIKIELERYQVTYQKQKENDITWWTSSAKKSANDTTITSILISSGIADYAKNYEFSISDPFIQKEDVKNALKNLINSENIAGCFLTFSNDQNSKNKIIESTYFGEAADILLNNKIYGIDFDITVKNKVTQEPTVLNLSLQLNNTAEVNELITTYGKTTSAVQDLFTYKYKPNSTTEVECKNKNGESRYYDLTQIEQGLNKTEGYEYVQRNVTNFTNCMDINSFITSSIHSTINSDGSTKVTGYEVGFDYKTKEEGGYEINPDSTHAYFAVDKFEVKVPTSNALNPFTGRTIMHVSEDDVYFSGNLKSESTTIRKIGTYDDRNIESIITGGNFNKTSRKILKAIKRVSCNDSSKDQVFIHPLYGQYVVLKRKLGAHNPFFIFSSKELGDKIQEVNSNIKLFEMYGSYVYFIQNHNTLWWYSEKVEDDNPGWHTAPINDIKTFKCDFGYKQDVGVSRHYFKVSSDMLYDYTYGNAYNVGASIEMDSLDYIKNLGTQGNEVHQSMFQQTSTYYNSEYPEPRAYFTEDNPDYLKYLIEVPSSIYYKNSASNNSIPFPDSYDLESCYEIIEEQSISKDTKHINLLETEQIIQFGVSTEYLYQDPFYLDLPYISSNTTTKNHFISGETMELYSNLGNNIIVHNTISKLVFNFDFILLNDETAYYELHTTHDFQLKENTTYSIECKFMSGEEPQGNSNNFGPGIYWVVSEFSNTKQKES